MAAAKKKTTKKKAPETEKLSELDALKLGLMDALPKNLKPFMRAFHAERIAEVKLRLRALNRAAMDKMDEGQIPEARLIAAIGNQERSLDKLLDSAGLGVRVEKEKSFI